MSVNVVRYRQSDSVRWGIADGDWIRPLEGQWDSTREFMREGAARARSGEAVSETTVPLPEVEILCPITRDRQFICQAVNYYSHMRESGMDPQKSPFNIFFRKASSCLAPAATEIVVPPAVQFLDYEVELGLVFSKDVSGAETVTEQNLHEYVGGLVVVNDVSARDVQLPEMQFYKGKSYRTFGPVGPYLTLVDRDDLAKFDTLRLRLCVNGEERQNQLTTDMIHRPAATLTELSALQDWQAGDLLATGTPGGCALQSPGKPASLIASLVSPIKRQGLIRKMAARNERILRPGDILETSIGTDDGALDLGAQHNKVVGA